MNAQEYLQDLRDRYYRQKQIEMQAKLSQVQSVQQAEAIRLHLSTLNQLLAHTPTTLKITASVALDIQADADYIIAFNALQHGYSSRVVHQALQNDMQNRDCSAIPEYVDQVMGRAETALRQQSTGLHV